jgi:hypothetical protein
MLTTMTEKDWEIALQVFEASRSRRGDKRHDDRKFLKALQYFAHRNITWRALPGFRLLPAGAATRAGMAARPGASGK